jgi:MoxR-like ATPase
VLLIDEVDRSDEEFEAFLLEVLAEHQVTIPEIGTVRATHEPCVVLTSNRMRELSEALRRRCLYLWIDYPSLAKELSIVRTKVPGIDERLAGDLTSFIQGVRRQRLAKTPGVAETLDWRTRSSRSTPILSTTTWRSRRSGAFSRMRATSGISGPRSRRAARRRSSPPGATHAETARVRRGVRPPAARARVGRHACHVDRRGACARGHRCRRSR